MARDASKKIYLQKAFYNARRCLKEARESMHPSAEKVLNLNNPSTGEKEEVMDIEYAIRWCVSFHVPEWSQSTWRMIRAAYNMMLVAFEKRNRISPERHIELSSLMAEAKGLTRKERGSNKKTSSRRKKICKPEDVQKIEDYLSSRAHLWGEPLIIWLWAAIGTGLRPNEWQTAELTEREDGRLILSSENFKYSEERSFGPRREIDITDMPSRIKACIRVHLQNVMNVKNGKPGEAEKFYKGCSALLLLLNQKLWPRRRSNINLYTGRHQFSSNAKADPNVSDVQRAALMGHKTTRTSRERYGKARAGSGGLTPKVGDPSVLGNIKEFEPKRAPQQTPKPVKSGKG